MALLHSPEKQSDFMAPHFELKGTDGQRHTLEFSRGEKGLFIAVICNHCPYVLAIIDRLTATAKQMQGLGFGVIAIMPNDTANYPADSFENMIKFAKEQDFSFPYVIDETQKIAKALDAVCTPEFYLFDKDDILQYRGRLDSAANKEATNDTVPELLNAAQAIAKNESPDQKQFSSMGCSIKWKS